MSYSNYQKGDSNPLYPQQFTPGNANSIPPPQKSQAPYPTQEYPRFVGSYHNLNQSTDSIGQRINNKQDIYNKYGTLAQQVQLDNQQYLESITNFDDQIPSSPMEFQSKNHFVNSNVSVTSSPTYNPNSQTRTFNNDLNYQQITVQPSQSTEIQKLRSNDGLSNEFSQMKIQKPSQQQQQQQQQPSLKNKQIEKQQQSYPQSPHQQIEPQLSQEQIPSKVSRFQKLKTEAVNDYKKNGKFTTIIQLEWVKALLEYAADPEFIKTYNVNGQYVGRELLPNEVKKNEHIFIIQAVKLLKKICTEKNDSEAEFILGSLYSNSPVIKAPRNNILEKNYDKSFDYYAKAARKSHPVALYRLAVSHELGMGCTGNEQKAFECFKNSANLGWVPSMFKLGVLYSRGSLKLLRSAKDAMFWFNKAAENSSEENPHALFEIARIYERDFPWLKKQSLSKSDAEFLRELDHLGLHQNDSKSLHYYKEAARFNYSPAQCKLGWCYEYGKLGCLIDPKKSIGWYFRSAKLGYSIAEMALSGWYLTGAKGVLEPNDKKAFLWASKAAQSGFVKAEYALGYYYEVGLGCEKDPETSKKFYLLAATQGHEKAIEKLKADR